MSLPASVAAVCFIVCHGGPAEHFKAMSEELSRQGQQVTIYATGPAFDKLKESGLEIIHFDITDSQKSQEDVAIDLARKCFKASAVITDVGHAFDVQMQETLGKMFPTVKRFAYYDNPEAYVPGGYSEVASKVMRLSQGVLFANSNLATSSIYENPHQEVLFEKIERIGIGYYPMHQAKTIALQRATQKQVLRNHLFTQQNLADSDQKILVYFGGNNKTYFHEALPAFLAILEETIKTFDLSSYIILFQQHPGAKRENVDIQKLNEWITKISADPKAPLIFESTFSSEQAQLVADSALYYQTSMGPQFVLAGIPVIQIGHEPYLDIVVQNNLAPSVTTAGALIETLTKGAKDSPSVDERLILDKLGIKEKWGEILQQALSSDL